MPYIKIALKSFEKHVLSNYFLLFFGGSGI
jgi:hypothetical protein